MTENTRQKNIFSGTDIRKISCYLLAISGLITLIFGGIGKLVSGNIAAWSAVYGGLVTFVFALIIIVQIWHLSKYRAVSPAIIMGYYLVKIICLGFLIWIFKTVIVGNPKMLFLTVFMGIVSVTALEIWVIARIRAPIVDG